MSEFKVYKKYFFKKCVDFRYRNNLEKNFLVTKDVQNRLILISNDDGLKAKGLKCLINIAKEFGRVLVVAPDTEKSGMSHSVTLHEPIYLNKISSRENLTIYACSGTPVDCVKIALHKILNINQT